MVNSTTQSCFPFSPKGIPITSIRFIPSSNNKYIGMYVQNNKSKDWVPVNIGLQSIPTLQQVRDADRNISLNTGSYTDAHFYIRSADGNNTSTAFYTDKNGGAIQSGNAKDYVSLNLQPLGGMLTYGGLEVATKTWVQTHAPSLQDVASVGNSFNGDLILGSAGNEMSVGSGPVGKGYGNTRLGSNALAALINADWNTAIGCNALASMKYGLNNVAIGEVCMADFIGLPGSFSNNTAIGDSAGLGMTQGLNNVLIGANTGNVGETPRPRGDYNTFLGKDAGYTGYRMNPSGSTATLGSKNIFIGYGAGSGPVDSTLSDQLRIGNINNYTTDKHIISGTMVQGAQALTFNASITVPSLAGSGDQILSIDRTGLVKAAVLTETDPVYTASIPNQLMYKGNIGASIDLNTYTITGIYIQTGNVNAGTGSNYPVPLAGKLEVVNQSTTFIWQTYHVYGDSTANNRGIWRREYYNGTWYPWTKLVDTFNASSFELLANKATAMTTVNNALYPTVQAIANKFYNGTTVAATQNQFFGLTDSTAYDMSPANNDWTWHDVFAFNASRYQYETTTDYGASWTANGVNATTFKQLTQQKQAVGAVTLTNTSGVPNGIRCTFIGVAFSNLGHVILGMLYQATQCNVDVTIESSPDNVVWTNLFIKTNVSLLNSAAGNIFRLNSAISTTYIRITITVNSASVAASTAVFTSLRGMALRGGNQGFGKEFEYPYNWTEDKYMRFTAPTYTGTGVLPTQYKLALLDTNNGNQLTMTDLGSAMNGSFIQNQTAIIQTANARMNGYLQAGRIYIGALGPAPITVGIYNQADITGGTTARANLTTAVVQADVTNQAYGYASILSTAAAAFVLPNLRHFHAAQGTIGVGSTVGTQTGFTAEASLTGANLNIGFLGALPSNGTSSYNLYMSGNAPNYLAGRLGLNTTALTNVAFRNSLAISGNPSSYGAFFDTQIASDVTSSATVYASAPYTAAAAFTVGTLTHFAALQGVIGAGSAISIQNGFTADSTMIGAANNYGFRGRVPAGTSNWNLYMDGSANNFLASRLGIGTTALSNCIVHITSPVTGSTTMYTHLIESRAASDVTSSMYGYVSSIGILDSFTMSNMTHFYAQQGTFGTATVTNQTGFHASAGMISGTSSNYAFKGSIPTGISSNWNLYMDGSAPNYLAGRLGIGTTNMNSNVHISLPLTGSTLFYNVNADGLVQSDITSIASYFRTAAQTAAATFTVGTINHFDAQQGIFGAGSTVSNQIGFTAGGNLIGATNNYGFYGGIPAGTNRWNLYMAGTAQNYFAGNVGIGTNLPSTKLEVAGGLKTSGNIQFTALATGSYQMVTVDGAGNLGTQAIPSGSSSMWNYTGSLQWLQPINASGISTGGFASTGVIDNSIGSVVSVPDNCKTLLLSGQVSVNLPDPNQQPGRELRIRVRAAGGGITFNTPVFDFAVPIYSFSGASTMNNNKELSEGGTIDIQSIDGKWRVTAMSR